MTTLRGYTINQIDLTFPYDHPPEMAGFILAMGNTSGDHIDAACSKSQPSWKERS